MAVDLHGWRTKHGFTQAEAAGMLGVSQTYLSLLENGSRPLTRDLRSRLRALGDSRAPDTLETEESFRRQLGALGYPGFRHLRAPRHREAPATLLLRALRQPDLDARVCEALPWVTRQYFDQVDWEWLVRQSKLHDFQNRLGLLLDLAGEQNRPMARAKSELEAARLLAEATFCWDSMPEATRVWMRRNRSPEAAHWNVVTRLRAGDLPHAE
ncbi:MAG: helix-turn-helix domain-containing protein [Bryobacteraceae bacterium]